MNDSRMRNNRRTDSLQIYLKEIRDESLLTAVKSLRSLMR